MKKKNIASRKPKSKGDKSSDAHVDWITSLAKESASNNHGTGDMIPSKEDRKRKRESKKNRRMEQKRQKQLEQEQQRLRRKSMEEKTHEPSESQRLTAPTKISPTSSLQQQSRSLLLLKLSKHRLRRLSQSLETIRNDVCEEIVTTKVRPSPYYDLPGSRNEKAPRTSYSSSELASSKKRKRRKWTADSIQPQRSDYSGIGLARISMYIEFADPSYYPKLNEEFREHIPGFFGKQRTKAMKRQTDGNMLWRRLADEKKNNRGNNKKYKGMSTDEVVQAIVNSTDRADLLG
jgi:hypothetical protein